MLMRRGRLVVVVIVLFCLLQWGLISYHTSSSSSSSHAGGEVKEPLQTQAELQLPPQSPHTTEAMHPTTPEDPCSDEICTGNLRYGSLGSYKLCERLAYFKTLLPSEKVPKQCRFIDGRKRSSVALVSCPGSGNTWVRGLLEKATGVCTGSIYCDAPLRNGGFIGESIKDGSVLVVKTHTSDFQWRDTELEKRNIEDSLYGSAILLIRNPFHTFVSERQRSLLLESTDTKLLKDQRQFGLGNVAADDASHVDKVSKEAFSNSSEWEQFVHDMSTRWQKTIIKWSLPRHSRKPLLVVRYEDLKKDVLKEVMRMLKFLNHTSNATTVAAALRGGYDKFRRSHSGRGDSLQHYSHQLREKVNGMILQTLEILKESKVDHLFSIREYLCKEKET